MFDAHNMYLKSCNYCIAFVGSQYIVYLKSCNYCMAIVCATNCIHCLLEQMKEALTVFISDSIRPATGFLDLRFRTLILPGSLPKNSRPACEALLVVREDEEYSEKYRSW